ncbi:DNA repair protein [Collimonas sp. H4R21]|uniref:DNA repair protein n=1 Tax=Collimonas rhizosphaerae TaxID=3126357 RepID=A0ABU9PQI3_9BURK
MNERDTGINFSFKRNDTVGAADAEADDTYLSECFVETGDLAVLQDTTNAKRIIVGRTGAGKSALIRKLKEVEEHVIDVPPQNLSLSYIANSDIINFFESAGVSLDLFYQLLWKHVLTVELLKYKFKIHNEAQKQSFLASLTSVFRRDHSKEQAINYLREWGEKFWNETEYRVQELTTKVETDLKAAIGADFGGMKLDASAGRKLTEEDKREVVQRGKKVVSQIQIKALSDVARMLSEDIFNDPQQKYFITIDGLDEHWVEESLRYKLIRSLIETVRSFLKLTHVKIVIALRVDLLNRVISKTKDAGFQEEKYESLYLKLRWSRPQLEELLDRRIEKLVRQRYTTRPVKLKELFPRQIGKITFFEYLVDRTFLRPRDAILFVNLCLDHAENRNSVTAQIVSTAEGEYSGKRMISLQEEWGGTYPFLSDYATLLQGRPYTFRYAAINREAFEEFFYARFSHNLDSDDSVIQSASDFILNGKGTLHSVLTTVFQVFYTVGLIGIKPDSTSGTYWSFHNNDAPSLGSIKPNSFAYVHPTFWRTLGIINRD